MQNPPVRGSCLCKAVTVSIASFNRDVVACHCSQCRKQTGHFVAAARVANNQLSIDGSEHLKWYKSSDQAERGFCSHCGSILFWRRLDSDQTSVMAGCLEAPTHLSLARHIYSDDKGDYYNIEPDAPVFGQAD